MTKIYRDYSQDELDQQYEQRTLVPDAQSYSKSWEKLTDQAKVELQNRCDIAYGDHPDEKLDVYFAAKGAATMGAPIHICVHGGAWRISDKSEAGFPATVFAPAGAIYIAPNFSLAPEASLDQIVDQVRRAIKFVYENAAAYGGAGDKIFLSGISSGGHLASMAAVTDWSGEFDCPPDLIKGVTMVSGPYDLEPVRLSARNSYLHLDESAARRNSAYLFLPNLNKEHIPPALFAWGGGELAEFQRQSQYLADSWEKTGAPSQRIFMENCNHFEMFDEFAKAQNPLVKAMLGQMGLD